MTTDNSPQDLETEKPSETSTPDKAAETPSATDSTESETAKPARKKTTTRKTATRKTTAKKTTRKTATKKTASRTTKAEVADKADEAKKPASDEGAKDEAPANDTPRPVKEKQSSSPDDGQGELFYSSDLDPEMNPRREDSGEKDKSGKQEESEDHKRSEDAGGDDRDNDRGSSQDNSDNEESDQRKPSRSPAPRSQYSRRYTPHEEREDHGGGSDEKDTDSSRSNDNNRQGHGSSHESKGGHRHHGNQQDNRGYNPKHQDHKNFNKGGKQGFKKDFKGKKPQNFQKGGKPQGQGQGQGPGGPQSKKKKFGKVNKKQLGETGMVTIKADYLAGYDLFNDYENMRNMAAEAAQGGEPILINNLLETPLLQLVEDAKAFGLELEGAPARSQLLEDITQEAFERQIPLIVRGILDITDDGYGFIVYRTDNYRLKHLNAFVPEQLITKFGMKKGHLVEAQVHPGRDMDPCPFVLDIKQIMDMAPDEVGNITPFEDLIPYYPLERLLLETEPSVKWDNLSMRVVDLLTPIGLGQRGLIVAPPRTGKTILQQGIANAIAVNNPEAHLIVLLIDERPEEVTDFRRQVKNGEVIASTFDESAESHVHAAEMVIEKARRMVEVGQHVIILLDSITRLARAYNALAANSGKILSGGVEANALQKPKRFFGSARNIEGGGSLTILGTALVETGSRMDEVIFEEFKGTGNMELHLDRGLVDKRIFPAISLERSGTRKEELLYHPDELQKVYSLRRAMKGVPSTEAMEMLIQRIRKTKTNVQFLMGLNR